MVPDPSSMFGRLTSACIRDEYVEQERKTVVEGVAFILLGAFSSVLTTYFLSLAGILV